MGFLVQHSLCFHAESETVNRRLAHLVSQHVDRISLGIQALYDPKGSAVDRRAKETRDRRIAQILD